jgi:hypothetical protein
MPVQLMILYARFKGLDVENAILPYSECFRPVAEGEMPDVREAVGPAW